MSLNILFIGPLTTDGWGKACREYIRALSAAGANVAFRPVYPGHPNKNPDEEMLGYISRHYSKYDAVIQNLLPYFFEYNAKFGKNIGLSAFETLNWRNCFPEKMKLMDQMWHPCFWQHCTHAIPEPVNPDNYKKEYPGLADQITSNKVVFYWMGEYIPRKNLLFALRAFHTEFHRDEPVEFVIKTNKVGKPAAKTKELVEYDILHMKKEMALYDRVNDYKKEILITDYISEDQIYGLHQSCDVFIMPSHGEAWSLPMFDAYGFGNHIISTKTGCFNDIYRYIPPTEDGYVESPNVYEIHSEYDNVDLPLEKRPYKDLFTPHERWRVPNLSSLMYHMRYIYDTIMFMKSNNTYKKELPDLTNYSHLNIGKRMLQCLS